MSELTHLDNNGKIKMVDISKKIETLRIAKGYGEILVRRETIDRLNSFDTPKGDVLTTAKIAGIMAGKQTQYLIPLCHNINISNIDIKFNVLNDKIKIFSTVIANDKTGAEMEALSAVSTAALTIYDMLKAIDKNMIITNITLLEKSGGKSKIFSGKIISINVSPKKGTKKKPVEKCQLIENFGIKNDAHANENSIRQVSFLSQSSFDIMLNSKKDIELNYGDFGENIDVDGIDVYKLPIGSKIIFLSGAILEVSKIGKECHDHCEIFKAVGFCIMPKQGIFCKVIKGGIIKKNGIFKVIINESIDNDC